MSTPEVPRDPFRPRLHRIWSVGLRMAALPGIVAFMTAGVSGAGLRASLAAGLGTFSLVVLALILPIRLLAWARREHRLAEGGRHDPELLPHQWRVAAIPAGVVLLLFALLPADDPTVSRLDMVVGAVVAALTLWVCLGLLLTLVKVVGRRRRAAAPAPWKVGKEFLDPGLRWPTRSRGPSARTGSGATARSPRRRPG